MITRDKLKAQIDKLPERFTIEELVESLVFMEKVESGLNNSSQGKKITEHELEKEMKKWFV